MAKLKATTYSYIEADTPLQLVEKYRELQTITGHSYTVEFVYDVKRSKHVAYYYGEIDVVIEEAIDSSVIKSQIEIGNNT